MISEMWSSGNTFGTFSHEVQGRMFLECSRLSSKMFSEL